MNYTGRLTLMLIVLCTIVGWELIQSFSNYYYFNVLENILKMIYIPLAWYLGLQYDKVKKTSHKDYLTGVYNRRSVDEYFPKLERQVAKKNLQLCIFFLDIDNFKVINDTQGHAIGDLVLQRIARILLENTRISDYIARWGGEEFLVISPFTTTDFSELFIKRMKEELLNLSDEMNIEIKVSIGSSIFTAQSSSLEELVTMADKKMYLAKNKLHRNSGN